MRNCHTIFPWYPWVDCPIKSYKTCMDKWGMGHFILSSFLDCFLKFWQSVFWTPLWTSLDLCHSRSPRASSWQRETVPPIGAGRQPSAQPLSVAQSERRREGLSSCRGFSFSPVWRLPRGPGSRDQAQTFVTPFLYPSPYHFGLRPFAPAGPKGMTLLQLRACHRAPRGLSIPAEGTIIFTCPKSSLENIY